MVKGETRVAFVALGCAKNLVDSEKMLGQLAEAGCALTQDENDADVVVINTCGFLNASRIEADEFIQEVIERKAAGKHQRLVVDQRGVGNRSAGQPRVAAVGGVIDCAGAAGILHS